MPLTNTLTAIVQLTRQKNTIHLQKTNKFLYIIFKHYFQLDIKEKRKKTKKKTKILVYLLLVMSDDRQIMTKTK